MKFIRDWKTKRIKSCNFKQNRLDKKKKEYNRTMAECQEIKIIYKRRGLNMMELPELMDEYKKWVEPSNENLLKNAFKKRFEDVPLTGEEFFEAAEKVAEEYKESGELDVPTFMINVMKNSVGTIIEKDVMKRIEDFESELGIINSMLGKKTIEEICVDPKAETGIDRASSIKKASFGIFMASYIELAEEKVLSFASSPDEVFERMVRHCLGYVFAVFRANHYEYDGIDLRELEGKTLDEIFKLKEDEVEDSELGKKVEAAMEKVVNDLKNSVGKISEIIKESDSYGFIDMYFKKELINEIESKFENMDMGQIMAKTLKHVEPNEGKKEVEWTEDELELKEKIDKGEDGE